MTVFLQSIITTPEHLYQPWKSLHPAAATQSAPVSAHLPVLDFCINGITGHVIFCTRVFSLSITYGRFAHMRVASRAPEVVNQCGDICRDAHCAHRFSETRKIYRGGDYRKNLPLDRDRLPRHRARGKKIQFVFAFSQSSNIGHGQPQMVGVTNPKLPGTQQAQTQITRISLGNNNNLPISRKRKKKT